MNKNIKINLALITIVFASLVLGCSDAGESKVEGAEKTIPKAYIGLWTAEDGSTVTIRSDGTGDYKFGGKSVAGGSVEVDEAAKEIRFSLLGFDAGKYKIDKPPVGNIMELDGLEYRRGGGGDSDKRDSVKVSLPQENELRALVYKSVSDFNEAVKSGDFSAFRSTTSKRLQDEASADKLEEAFASAIRRKPDLAVRSPESLKFAPEPSIEKDEYLSVTVNYPNAAGERPSVHLDYEWEGGEWKLFGIELNPGKSMKGK